MLNNPKKVPSPGSAALQEALNLIAGLGSGDKNLKAMLEEMKKVQKHNEKVVQDAVQAVSKVNKDYENYRHALAELEAEKEAFNKHMMKREQALDLDRVEFEKAKTTFSDSNRKRDNEYNERHGKLVNDEMALLLEKERLDNQEAKMKAYEKEINQRAEQVFKDEGNLIAIKEYLKAHI
jgi:DNA repair exonuclease SbcCD ATPase subunit